MSPANLGFEKNLQGVLVHFIPLRNCNKLLILPVCSGTARRTEFCTEGQQHHVEMHWLTLSSHSDSSLFNLPFMLSPAQPLTHQHTHSLFQSVTHSLGLLELSLTSPPIAHSFSQSYIQSPVTCFISLGSHTVAEPCTVFYSVARMSSLNIPHVSVSFQSFNLSLTAHPPIQSVTPSLVLSEYWL